MANYTKLKVIWKNNLNNIYKDNTIIGVGQEAVINMDENGISNIYVNFKVNNDFFTDLVKINGNVIQVPFKTDVLKAGTHQLEIVAYLKNGDVVPSPTFSYYVEKSLKNTDDIKADTHYPVLIELLEKVEEWNEKIPYQEEQRIANENERKSNEINRQSNENTRQSNESSRQQYETQRRVEEDERLTDEQVRVNAENIRIANENERLRKEIERQNAEELRRIAYNSSLYARMDEAEDRLNEVNSQLADIAYKQINCKSLGMIPNDVNSGVLNYEKLTNALNEGFSIYVDDVYYIEGENETIKSFDLQGISNNAELIFTSNDYTWFIADGLNINQMQIKNLKIRNLKESHISILRSTNRFYINKFNVINSYFAGKLTVINVYMNYSDNVYDNKGFGIITIKNNTFKNCMGDKHIFLLNDCMHDKIIISENYVNNFNKTFFYSSFTNDQNKEIRSKMKSISVVNNTVINDDDVWLIDTPDYYYCFVLYEGVNGEYKNNHVEGLKMDFYGGVVYDAYFNVDYIYYENNTYKNILNLRPDVSLGYPALFKSKAGKEKYCINNKFLVDYDWALLKAQEKGLDLNNTCYKPFEFITYVDKFIYRNNIVQVHDIKLTETKGIGFADISNNTFKSNRMNGSLIYMNANKYIDAIQINNNSFICTEKEVNPSANSYTNPFSFVCFYNYTNEIKNIDKIRINNNYVYSCNIDAPIIANDIEGRYTSLILNDVEFEGNRIEYNNNVASDLYILDWARQGNRKEGYVVKNLSYKDNVIIANNKNIKGVKSPVLVNNFKYTITGIDSYFKLLCLNGDIKSDKDYIINGEIVLNTPTRNNKTLCFSLKLSHDISNNRNKIEFTTSNDNNAVSYLIKSTDSDYKDAYHNVKVKLTDKFNNEKDTITSLTLLNSNSEGVLPELMLSTGEVGNKIISVNITTLEV